MHAIHPSVEWRFRRAVLDSIEEHDGEATKLSRTSAGRPHPVRGDRHPPGRRWSDLATQADLGVHLRLAFEVVEAARAIRPLPILDETGKE